MKLYFILYTDIIQEGLSETDSYRIAIDNNALIKVDEFNNELLISKLSDELIEKILKSHISDTESTDYEDDLTPLDGGLRIEFDKMTIDHQCCSELNDYKNWEKIIDAQTKEWNEIWIGHPSIYYRFDNDVIEISDYYDSNPKQEDIKTRLRLDKGEFLSKLEKSIVELNDFKRNLYRVVDIGDFKNKNILKGILLK